MLGLLLCWITSPPPAHLTYCGFWLFQGWNRRKGAKVSQTKDMTWLDLWRRCHFSSLSTLQMWKADTCVHLWNGGEFPSYSCPRELSSTALRLLEVSLFLLPSVQDPSPSNRTAWEGLDYPAAASSPVYFQSGPKEIFMNPWSLQTGGTINTSNQHSPLLQQNTLAIFSFTDLWGLAQTRVYYVL